MDLHSPRTAKIALAIAVVLALPAIITADPFVIVITSPFYALPLSVPILAYLSWLIGPRLRIYLHGGGHQHNWGYRSFTIRGEMDDNGCLWVSLSDCQLASDLPLEQRLDRAKASDKREDPVKGWLVTESGMRRVIDSVRGEITEINKLRLFLDREVWRTRAG